MDLNLIDKIDYLPIAVRLKMKFIFRHPKLAFISNVFTLPFSISVWISTIFLGVIIMLVLYITIKVIKMDFNNVE